jgi:hypothetical protein
MMLGTLWQDLKHGARMLRKNPGFSLVAMASIAIGVGANAAMFSMADTLVLSPLTIPRASEFVTVTAVVPKSGFASPTSFALSYPDYQDVRDQARSFSGLVAFRLIVASFADRADQPAQRKFGMAVSGNLFDTLGVQPALGRTIGVDQDRVVGRESGRRPRPRALAAGIRRRFWRRRTTHPSGRHRDDRHRRHAGGLHRARPVRAARLLRSVCDHARADQRQRRDRVGSPGPPQHRGQGPAQAGCLVEQAAEEVALIGRNLERSLPDTNRNQGLTARTEFDARVEARPQLAVGAVMLMTMSMPCCWSRARTWRVC